VVVDITTIGLPNEIYPEEGKPQMVPTLRFQSWKNVEQHLRVSGATAEMIENTSALLKKMSIAVLSIV
jgi:hypothetical protein